MAGLLKRWFRRKHGFFGDFNSWEKACQASRGYNAPLILQKTEEAMRDLLAGKACFERDSVLFSKPEYPWPLLACLLRVAQEEKNRLSVLDFGGALGSSYYQCRDFLRHIPDLAWSVVEQNHYVESGRRNFSSERPDFYFKAQDAVEARAPNVLLLSSVLPYLASPYEVFRDLLLLKIRHVVIDRTFFLLRPGERLTVQRVPSWIYEASYPAWFLDEGRLRDLAKVTGYRLVADFRALDDNQPSGERALAKGFYWQWMQASSSG